MPVRCFVFDGERIEIKLPAPVNEIVVGNNHVDIRVENVPLVDDWLVSPDFLVSDPVAVGNISNRVLAAQDDN